MQVFDEVWLKEIQKYLRSLIASPDCICQSYVWIDLINFQLPRIIKYIEF